MRRLAMPYDAVQRLRPRWLHSRGSRSTRNTTEIVVALNGNCFGGLVSLQQFSFDDLDGLRCPDSATASSMVRGVGPALECRSRSGYLSRHDSFR